MDPAEYGLIGKYGVQMTITFLIGLGVWTIKVMQSKTDTIAWYNANFLRILISFVLFWVISAGLVIVPNIALILGSVGFNADQSAAGIALVIVGFLLKSDAKPQQPLEVAVVPKKEEPPYVPDHD